MRNGFRPSIVRWSLKKNTFLLTKPYPTQCFRCFATFVGNQGIPQDEQKPRGEEPWLGTIPGHWKHWAKQRGHEPKWLRFWWISQKKTERRGPGGQKPSKNCTWSLVSPEKRGHQPFAKGQKETPTNRKNQTAPDGFLVSAGVRVNDYS